jgi:hypothetical protein
MVVYQIIIKAVVVVELVAMVAMVQLVMVEQDFHLHFLELLQHILAVAVDASDQVLHLEQMVEMVILLLALLLVIILAVVVVVDEVGLRLVVRAVRV